MFLNHESDNQIISCGSHFLADIFYLVTNNVLEKPLELPND